jgi:hypothetical protein
MIEAAHPEREFHHRRLADDDGAGPAQPLDDNGVRAGNAIGEQRRTGSRAYAGRIDIVLHGDRHAMQEAQPSAFGVRPIDARGVGARAGLVDGRKRAKSRVQSRDPREGRFKLLRSAHRSVSLEAG